MADHRVSIAIDSFFNNKGLTSARRAMIELDRSINNIYTSQQKMFTPMEKVRSGRDLFSNMNADALDFQKTMQQDKYLRTFGLSMDGLTTAAHKNSAAYKKMITDMRSGGFERFAQKNKTALESLRKEFSMEFLGVMFFGMMLQKFFTSLAKSTVSSFMKITEGMTSSGQAVSALLVSWELLKFSIGSAIATVLESVLPIIMPIVMGFADWVQQNEKLVGWFTLLGIAVGGVLFLFGQMWLGVEALNNVFSRLFGAGFLANAGAATEKLSGFQRVLNGLTTIVGISFIIEGITDFIEGGKNSLLSGLSSIATGLGLMLMTKGGKLGTAGLVMAGLGLATNLFIDSADGIKKSLLSDAIDVFTAAFIGFKAGGIPGAIGAITIAVLFKIGAVKWLAEQGDKIDNWANKLNPDLKYSYSPSGILGSDDIAEKKLLAQNPELASFPPEVLASYETSTIAIKDVIDANLEYSSITLPKVQDAINVTTIKQTALNESVSKLKPPSISELKGTIFDPEATKKSSVAVDSYTTAVSGLDTALGGTSDNNGKKTGGLNSAFSTLTTDFNDFSLFLENTYLPLMDDLQDSLWANARAASAAAAAHERYNRALEGSTGEASD